jgi:hypothetical protein
MPKWTYTLAFFFLLFLVYTDPSGAGEFAGQFAAFAVRLLGGIGEFLTGLFQGASDPTVIDTSTGTSLLSDGGTTNTSVITQSTLNTLPAGAGGTLPAGAEGTVAGLGDPSVSGIITHSHDVPHTHVPTTNG